MNDRGAGGDGDGDGDGRNRLPALAKRSLQLLALALVVEYLVLPQLGGARRAIEVVSDVSPALLAAGAALQVVAHLAHAQLTRSLVPAGSRPSLELMARIELSSRAVSHVVPGGTAAGAALGFRLLQRSGVRGPDAGFAAAAQGVGSALVLHSLVWLTLAVSIPLRGFHPFYTGAGLAGLGLAASFAALVVLLTKGEDRAASVVEAIARKVPVLDAAQAGSVVHRLAERLEELSRSKAAVARAAGWAAVHWLSDAASLWVFLAAFGIRPGVDVLIVAFGIGSMLATIPVSPRGLGVFEGAVIAILLAFDLPSSEVIIGVVSYRLVNFWLPIPLGAASYLSVQATLSEKRHPVRSTLRNLVDEAVDEAQGFAAWARERAIRLPSRDP